MKIAHVETLRQHYGKKIFFHSKATMVSKRSSWEMLKRELLPLR